jgi:uncharacterized protein
MRVNVADIKLEAGAHKSVPVSIAVEPVDLGGQAVQFDRPFEGHAEIWNAGDRLLVRADLSGQAVVQCCRCLSPFSMPLHVKFEEEFVEGSPADEPADNGDDEDEDEVGDESGRTVSYYTGDEINLSEPLQEYVLLEVPMKPLCDEDCQGLCPTCGTNLNEGSCQCMAESPAVVDPRLAKLADLLRKPDSHS